MVAGRRGEPTHLIQVMEKQLPGLRTDDGFPAAGQVRDLVGDGIVQLHGIIDAVAGDAKGPPRT